MIKVKVFQSSCGHRKIDDSYQPVADYLYCVYFLGIMIHTVTIRDVHRDSVQQIFGNKPIIKKEIK